MITFVRQHPVLTAVAVAIAVGFSAGFTFALVRPKAPREPYVLD